MKTYNNLKTYEVTYTGMVRHIVEVYAKSKEEQWSAVPDEILRLARFVTD